MTRTRNPNPSLVHTSSINTHHRRRHRRPVGCHWTEPGRCRPRQRRRRSGEQAAAESQSESHQELRRAAGRPDVGQHGGRRHRAGRSALGLRPVRRELCAGSNVGSDPEVRSQHRQAARELRPRPVHLPARHPRRSRRQRLGHRRPRRQQRGAGEVSGRAGQGPHRDEVQPGRQGAAAARQAGRGCARHRYVQRAERRHHGAERRHLRLGRPQRPESERRRPTPMRGS